MTYTAKGGAAIRLDFSNNMINIENSGSYVWNLDEGERGLSEALTILVNPFAGKGWNYKDEHEKTVSDTFGYWDFICEFTPVSSQTNRKGGPQNPLRPALFVREGGASETKLL